MPIVTSLDDLHRLTATPLPYFPEAGVQVDLAKLDLDLRVTWSERLSRHYGACGCTSGAVSLVVFFVAAISFWLIGYVDMSFVILGGLLVGALISSAVGKAIGIASGRIMLRHDVKVLSKVLQEIDGRTGVSATHRASAGGD